MLLYMDNPPQLRESQRRKAEAQRLGPQCNSEEEQGMRVRIHCRSPMPHAINYFACNRFRVCQLSVPIVVRCQWTVTAWSQKYVFQWFYLSYLAIQILFMQFPL